MSAARFCLTTEDGCPVPHTTPIPGDCAHRVESARRQWPPVVVAHVGCPPPPYHCSGCHRGSRRPLWFNLPTIRPCSSLLCSAPAAASPTAKRSASSLRPSCTKSLPAAPTSEAGPRDFPAVIFLCEHLTESSLLRLFLHPANPAASSAPPRMSSPTTSPTASTTPSAPYRCPLPVSMRTTAESLPPVSTPFLASPPRFSCSSL
jgi:hypothetical protein